MKFIILLAICLTAVVALPTQPERIIGGSVTNINFYPFACNLIMQSGVISFRHQCGGTIVSSTAMLSATHCWITAAVANRYRVRVGSTNANSGGAQHNVARLISHPHYNSRTHDNDVGVVRVATAFQFGNSVRLGSIAGPTHNPPDNANVIAIGWGNTTPSGNPSEQLRHVQLRVANQVQCQNVYGPGRITANMLCAIWPGGGRGSCFGDSGTGLIFNNIVVGVTSFGRECASARYPGVYARVSRFTNWIWNNS